MAESELEHALRVYETDPDIAYDLTVEHLRKHPEDAKAFFLLGVLYSKAERYGPALAMYEAAIKRNPGRSETWGNRGMALHEMGKWEDAISSYQEAYKRSPKACYLSNMAGSYQAWGKHKEAEDYAGRALKLDPTDKAAKINLGFSRLCRGDWGGWPLIENCLGGKHRKMRPAADEPLWDGKPVKRLFLYGEQGIGDEIMYASCIADAMHLAEHITLECDPRLEGLFRRSFPGIEVYGTRKGEREWLGEPFDASCPTGSLVQFFRQKPEDCPRKPYLVADPERRVQWRALLDFWGKKAIGLCWSGGKPKAHATDLREIGLEAFKPILSPDIDWISLQYRDAAEEIARTGFAVRDLPRATQTDDYDDTAALVAELSAVVGVHTSVHHLAGAMGVPSIILVPAKPIWLYAHGAGLAWYGNQPYHRQKPGESWESCIARLSDHPLLRP